MKKNMKILLFFSISLILSTVQAQDSDKQLTDPVIPGRIILKIKPQFKEFCNPKSISLKNTDNYINEINGQVKKLFPYSKSPETLTDKFGQKLVDITTIYEIDTDTSFDLNKIAAVFESFPETEYCHPYYLPQLFYVPNDPAVPAQYYLGIINAYQAWDICKGDSNIVVGITDTGIESTHVELINNIFYNFNDPIDGLDNDYDGYTDNFRGWDIGNNDNNPEWNLDGAGFNPHGISVSGLAGARTDNNTGIASAGFHTNILPVKISDSTGVLVRAYEGIVYAADHGCAVVNCSWGGVTQHPFGQDIINYATFNCNSLVVAAAGNNGNTTNSIYYPSAYENVLCVAATNQYDYKWLKSCYGPQVDLCAPGESIYVLTNNNGYTFGNGTSLSSPIAATCTALLMKMYGDTLSPLQVVEILKMTCDNIDTIPANTPFAGNLGKGRINLHRALTFHNNPDSLIPSVRFIDYSLNNNSGKHTKPGDTVNISGSFINYLFPSQNLTATISTTNPNITVIQPYANPGAINTLQSVHLSNCFTFHISEQAGYNETVEFQILFNDVSYTDKQLIKFTINPSFGNIDTNKIDLTLTSNGRVGFNNFMPLQGTGFRYNSSSNLLFEGGFFAGISSTKSLKCFKGYNDFTLKTGLEPQALPAPADERWISAFSDELSSSGIIGLDVVSEFMEWVSPEFSDFVILNYYITNTNDYTLNNLYAGIYCDWDIINSYRNKVSYNSELRMLYSWYSSQTNLYTAIKPLTYSVNNFYAFDITENGNGGINITDGLSNSELFEAMTSNRFEAGTSASGNDIACLVSSGPFTVPMYDTLMLTFALLASNSIYNLEIAANNAQLLYDSLYTGNKTYSINDVSFTVFPNPCSKFLNIKITSGTSSRALIRIFNSVGQNVITDNNYVISEGNTLIRVPLNIGPGIYNLWIQASGRQFSAHFVVE